MGSGRKITQIKKMNLLFTTVKFIGKTFSLFSCYVIYKILFSSVSLKNNYEISVTKYIKIDEPGKFNN